MKSRSNILAIYSVVIISLLLVGCLGTSVKQSEQNLRGSAQFSLILPPSLLAAGDEYKIHVATIEVTLEKGQLRRHENVQASSGPIIVSFEDLQVGTWDVSVQAKDSDGYTVFAAGSKILIIQDAVTEDSIELKIEDGDLTVQVEIPHGLEVTRGEVLLRDLLGSPKVRELDIQGQSGIAAFQELTPNTWPIEVELFSGNDSVAWGYGDINILPGRETTALVKVLAATGELIIELDWKRPPREPTDLRAGWAND